MRRKVISFILSSILIFFAVFGMSGVFIDSVNAAGASLYLTPSVGTYVIDSEFTVSVKLNTGGEVVNAAEGSLSYNAKSLEVVSFSRSGSVFSLWTTEPSVSNGSIEFGGGAPKGYNGSDGHVFNIKFKAKAPGVFQVNFTSGAALISDGKGTNILASMGTASFNISPKIEAPKVESINDSSSKLPLSAGEGRGEGQKLASGEEYNHPKIESISNPDQNAWSNNPNLKFAWVMPTGTVDVSFALNQEPVFDLGQKSNGALTGKEYLDVEDGIWYFHLKFKDGKKWGSVADYRVMIDTRPPNPLEVKIREVGIGEWPELLFSAQDKESGLSDYEIFIGSLEHQSYKLSDKETALKMSALGIGEHTAMVVAKDKAGNEIVSTIKFNINPIESPLITSYQKEMESANDFYLSGTALPNISVIVYLQKENQLVASSTVQSDANGAWFYVGDKKLQNGRYVAWAEAINSNGIKSKPTEKITFIVSPPIFAVVGNFVINYVSVFTSLLLLIILIIFSVWFVVGKIRNKLRKETFEVEDSVKRNMKGLEGFIDEEFSKLNRFEGKANYEKKKRKLKDGLRARVDVAEKKVLKEVKDVEDVLK